MKQEVNLWAFWQRSPVLRFLGGGVVFGKRLGFLWVRIRNVLIVEMK